MASEHELMRTCVGCSDVSAEQAVFARDREQLVTDHYGRWLLLAEGKFQGAFDTHSAAVDAGLKNTAAGGFLVTEALPVGEDVVLTSLLLG